MESSRFIHVYNRGVDRRTIFSSEEDYRHFFHLLERYLLPGDVRDKCGVLYPNFSAHIRIHAFCLMPNHFHMCIEELTPGSLGRFMQSLKGAYARYFNLTNDRTGVLFETKYHAKELPTNDDLINAIRYIHMNALVMTDDYPHYKYSSLRYYQYMQSPTWLETTLFRSLFPRKQALLEFHEDYKRKLAIDALMLINV